MLSRLRSSSGDHFGVATDEVTWGDSGTVELHAELLKRITDPALHEGKHAA